LNDSSQSLKIVFVCAPSHSDLSSLARWRIALHGELRRGIRPDGGDSVFKEQKRANATTKGYKYPYALH